MTFPLIMAFIRPYGEIVLHAFSCFCISVWRSTVTDTVSESFQDVCIVNIQKRRNSPSIWAKGRFAYSFWNYIASSSGAISKHTYSTISTEFLFYKVIHQLWRYSPNFFILSWGNCGRIKLTQEKNIALATIIAVSKKMSFVSIPGVSCLLPWNYGRLTW